MIRTTVNQSIMSASKPAHTTPGRGESYEHVVATAVPGGYEKRDIDARDAGQSTTPSDAHNGPRE